MAKSANELRSFRIKKGYSEKQVADILGIKNPNTIIRWEKGVTMPNSAYLLAMCDLYGAKLADLYPVLWKKTMREINERLRLLKKKKGKINL